MSQLKKCVLAVAVLCAMAIVPAISEAGPLRFTGRVAARTVVGTARVGVAATPPYRPYYRPYYGGSYSGYAGARTTYYRPGYYYYR